MKILIAASEFPPGPGGIGTHAYELAKHLTALGHVVTVVCRQHHSQPDEQRAFNAVQPFDVIRMPSAANYVRKSTQQTQWILKHVTEIAPDMVIASGTKIVWSVAAANLLRPFQWVAVGHGTEFGHNGWRLRLTRAAFQRAGGVVCVSNFTKDYMVRRGIFPPEVAVIPNGADETVFYTDGGAMRQACRAELGIADDAPVLVTVGNVTPRKGQEIVIRALPRVIERHPKAVYIMAGLPTDQAALTALASELGVAAHIRFLGRITQAVLVSLLNSADLFVMTSRQTQDGDFEGYGIAVVEAALCGLPAVVSSGSGLSEAIVHGKTGLEVRMNDPIDTAAAINRLLDNTILRRLMGENAERRACAEQTWGQRVRRYEQFIYEVQRRDTCGC